MKKPLSKFYDYFQIKDPDRDNKKEKYLEARFYKLTKQFQSTTNNTLEYDTANLTVHGLLKNGKIDTDNQTIIFPETPNIIELVKISIGNVTSEKTYHYTLEGDLLTLTLEDRDENNDLTAYFKVKFKKIADADSK